MIVKYSLSRLINALAAPVILFYALPWLMILIVLGTVTQPSLGLYQAVEQFLGSWVFWVYFIPLPAGLPILILIGVSLLTRFVFFSHWIWRKAGVHLSHLGVLVLLIGGLITMMTAQEGYMIIPEEKSSAQVYAYENGEIRITPPREKEGASMIWGRPLLTLPFTLTLDDFVRENHPSTDTPRRYYSDVSITHDNEQFTARIDMNEPLRLNGFTLYQSSFLDVGDKQATVLQVVKNEGRLLPYISGLLMSVGLLLHLILMRDRKS